MALTTRNSPINGPTSSASISFHSAAFATLNAIEPFWKRTKRVLSPEIFADRDISKRLCERRFFG